jgi:DNA sulfur modification protein DndC
MMKPKYRVRKQGERKKDGSLSSSPMRMGPYTMEARFYGLSQVLSIQEEVNAAALMQNRPLIDLINEEEHARILQLQSENTWPNRWTGEEVRADVMVGQVITDELRQDPLWAIREDDRDEE